MTVADRLERQSISSDTSAAVSILVYPSNPLRRPLIATDTGDARHECPVCQKCFTRRYKRPCVIVMTRLTDGGCQRRNDKTCCSPWRGFHSDQESPEGVMVCERPLTRQLSHSLLANHVSLPNFVVTDSLVQHVEDVCIQAGHVLIEQGTAQLQFP